MPAQSGNFLQGLPDTVCYSFSPDFSLICTAGTGLFVITMLVADFAVHSARGKHFGINILFRHLHNGLLLSGSEVKSAFVP